MTETVCHYTFTRVHAKSIMTSDCMKIYPIFIIPRLGFLRETRYHEKSPVIIIAKAALVNIN